MNVLVLLGSLRAGSTNRALADAAVAHLPEGCTATVFNRGAELPHYSEDLDLEGQVPEVAAELRSAVAAADGLIVVTPEYNGTLSSVLKNTIDWASRPYGSASIGGTPAVVMAASGSPRAAEWARQDAVRTLQVAGAAVIEETFGVGASFEPSPRVGWPTTRPTPPCAHSSPDWCPSTPEPPKGVGPPRERRADPLRRPRFCTESLTVQNCTP